MALINNLYVHVVNEDWDNGVESTSHPVEKGLELTDTVKVNAITVSLSGHIVDVDSTTAQTICDKLKELQKAGSLIKYVGRKTASNMQIQSFNESYSNEIWGGFSFSMELKEVRIAKPAYVEEKPKTSPTKQIEVGDIVVFKGGNVYVSSDAAKPATSKGRQSCKVTKINTRSWSLHDYHLISTEKKYPYNVYGWVDGADIEGCTAKREAGTSTGSAKTTTSSSAKTNPTTKAGTTTIKTILGTNFDAGFKNTTYVGLQKVVLTNDSKVSVNPYKIYHKIFKGDTLDNIVKSYKELRQGQNSTCPFITASWIAKRQENKEGIKTHTYTVQDKTYTTYNLVEGKNIFVGYCKTKYPEVVEVYR